MHGPHETRLDGRIGQRPSNLADQDGEVRVDDMRVRPEPGLEVALRHDVGPVLEQRAEQVERLDGQMDLALPGEELPPVRVEDERSELQLHDLRCRPGLQPRHHCPGGLQDPA